MGRLVIVAGPTASGKTALAIRLAQALDGEIVSADSMQIYKRLDIGTAKPTAWEQAQAPHHMIDVVEPGAQYSVSRYAQQAAASSQAAESQPAESQAADSQADGSQPAQDGASAEPSA